MKNHRDQLSRVHIVGIGGAGMSAIAMVLAEQGVRVSGSDLKASASFEKLKAYGVELFIGHDASNIGSCDAVVISSAIPSTNPEVVAANANGIALMDRSDFFPHLLRNKKPIGIAGTHGKTTTTSMLALTLIGADLNPSYIIGGELNETGTSGAHGSGDYFVIEADESDKSFLSLGAYGALVTNIEKDHIESYGNYASLKRAFYEFVSSCEGPKVVGTYLGDMDELRKIEGVVTFGEACENDFKMTDLRIREMSCEFVIEGPNKTSASVKLLVPGRHNAMNATGAIAMAFCLGVPMEQSCDALSRFTGVSRRFQIRGDVNGSLLIDDYAHLPSELSVTLDASRAQWPNRRLIAVFQPHRYTRTQLLYKEFANALTLADLVVLTDIYPAGETALPGVSAELIATELNSKYQDTEVLYHPRRNDLGEFVLSVISPGDIVITLGAGDITALSNEITELSRSKNRQRREPI